eukprot:CAMPEP_0176396668 /NCGR_PEP_ID=MMETSP0126-20121128/44452_1 /TAXON_ID=141414 ORGANISM="Strombidinopsis acuminatum, Strain SPMC142" /NCGR_SAMPLE_ID=MMETSP0126 /ASSEMBLY_ACC=CAM_ASM_000229 /LENGTH=66 /DNA_ID=CAMNT_0017770403 /DNA_START=215 /DNA_END=416 /DNA_ORIENTATION=+
MDAMQEQYGSEDDEEGEFEQDEEDLMMENDDERIIPILKEGKAVVTHKKLKRDEVKIVSRLIKKYG